jgi:coenzyme F420-0:L-glutamate ligase/coenzyme F420-1:gamma-L-glutamate ligase
MLKELCAGLKERRSVQRYRRQRVAQSAIARLIEAGTWAPSAHNAQPWRFVVIQSKVKKRLLAETMADSFRRDLERDGKLPTEAEARIAASLERFQNAPLLLLACLTMKPLDRYKDSTRQQAEYAMGVQSVAAAIRNILLAAYAEGLGSCWHCAPLFCPAEVRRVLQLPEELQPQALITVGVPAESPAPPPRDPIGEVVLYRG